MVKEKNFQGQKVNIPIAFSVNQEYVPYFCALLNSLAYSKNDCTIYTAYVLYSEIDGETLKKIKQYGSYKKIDIVFINVINEIKKYDLFIGSYKSNNYITRETYYRLLLPWLLMDVSKILYLDADIIVKTDLSELYQVDLENKLIAAVLDIADNWKCAIDNDLKDYRNTILNLSDCYMYFNAGVLLMNLEGFRFSFVKNELLEIASKQNWRKHDQDVLNMICQGNFLKLPFQWNLIDVPKNNLNMPCLANEREQYIKALQSPCIIHYAAHKPWREQNVFFEIDFWKMAIESPFFKDIISRFIDNLLEQPDQLKKHIEHCFKTQKLGIRYLMQLFSIWLRNKIMNKGH